MTEIEDRGDEARLVEVEVADPPDAWAAAGFTVIDSAVRIGATTFRLTGPGPEGERKIRSWTLSGLELGGSDLDGLPTHGAGTGGASGAGGDSSDADGATGAGPPHANGTIGLDHVVVLTPDLDRTIAALANVGLGCRRIRETESYGSPMRQAFFRLGPTVLEVISGDTGSGRPAAEAPATWFGLAVDVVDLDATAALLGEGLGSIKGAVQAGRRIATIRHKALDMSVAVAAMDDRGDR